jgi:hypothetical protein
MLAWSPCTLRPGSLLALLQHVLLALFSRPIT